MLFRGDATVTTTRRDIPVRVPAGSLDWPDLRHGIVIEPECSHQFPGRLHHHRPVAGGFTITASKEGLALAKQTGIALESGGTADVRIQLNVAGVSTAITVAGVAGEIRTDAPQLGDRIPGRQLQETPLLDRRISFLPLLNLANRPAINQGDIFMTRNPFTTAGAGRRQTWFDVDGSTDTDSWGRQIMFTSVPLPAVQKMNILVNSFSAEFGGSTGSTVTIVTRTNSLRGEVPGVWRPSATEAAAHGLTSSMRRATTI